MIKTKLTLYMIILNILPFLTLDLTLQHTDFPIKSGTAKTITYILIYITTQIMLYKFILKNLYNRKLISHYVPD